MAAEPNSAMFETTVAVTGNNTGNVVPEEAIERLAAGQRPPRAGQRPDNARPVLVNVNGYEYRNTAGVMGAHHRDLGLQLAATVIDGAAMHGGQGRWVLFTGQVACTGGSWLWLPDLRLAFQKGHLAAQTWWAQLGSNQ